MRRLIVPVVVAAFAVGCGERAINPTSPLSPRAASLDLGNPPPPPVAGDGRADLDVFQGDDSQAASCSGHTTFTFAWDYFVNKQGNNAFLHIRIDGQGLDVSVHQTDKKVDAHGDITAPGFDFSINDVISGGIIDQETHVPGRVVLNLVGTFTDEEGNTCTANATLTASLNGNEPPPVP
jgi:hypothetical protein